MSSEWFEVARFKASGYRIMAITSAFQADDVGSIPTTRSMKTCRADIAQVVERTLGKGEVGGSIPPISTIYSVQSQRSLPAKHQCIRLA